MNIITAEQYLRDQLVTSSRHKESGDDSSNATSKQDIKLH